MPKPRWTSSSFLLYLGMFTLLGSITGAYAYLTTQYGDLAFAGWTALMFALLTGLAVQFRRYGTWLPAAVFAYLSIAALGGLIAALYQWWGWGSGSGTSSPFDGWHWSTWLAIVVIVAASIGALRRFQFPFFALTICLGIWFLITDVVSGGGSWSAVVTLLIGFVYFGVGLAVGRVTGFWVHVVSGGLIGGALLYWWRSSTAGWWLLVVVALLFVAVGVAVRRSSWTVIGAAGLFASSVHFSIDWTTGSFSFFTGSTKVWIPIVVAAVLGFVYIVLGLAAGRRDAPAVPTAE